MYKIHSEQNPFVLPVEGGKFELPFICKKQTYLNDQFIEETYSSLNGLRFKTISTGNVWFLTVRKDGEKSVFTNSLLWEKDHITKKQIQSAILTYIPMMQI